MASQSQTQSELASQSQTQNELASQSQTQEEYMVTKTKRQKSSILPVGVSVQRVASRGLLPQCTTCKQIMQQNEKRVVRRLFCKEKKGFVPIESYHTNAQCLTWLTGDQRIQLIK